MNFQERDRVVYQTNPLVEVVCQLRFHKLFAIDESVPAGFQRDLGANYPKATTRAATTIQLSVSPEDTKRAMQTTLYDFSTEDDRFKITLTSDFLVVSTSGYLRWEEFEEHLSASLHALLKNYQISRFTRVGLRYVNMLDREGMHLDAPWTSLIRHSALGLIADNKVPIEQISEHSSTTIFEIENGKLALRQGLRLKDGKPDGSYIIDNDIFSDKGIETDGNVIDLLRQFNATARNAFRWLVQEQLHAALGPREPDAG